MFILGCVIYDFNYPETSCAFGLAVSQLASLTFLPRGFYNLSISYFMGFQNQIKGIKAPLTASQR